MQAFEKVVSPIAVLPVDNVNTDQIIPARFLKRTDAQGWGTFLFADWRQNPAFPLRNPAGIAAGILLAGENFGCGSSREHAAWALRDSGFCVVIAPSFADIFRENAVKNRLLPALVSKPDHASLMERTERAPTKRWTVDLASQSLNNGETAIFFQIDPFSKHCLTHGVDELEYILQHEYAITAHEVYTANQEPT